MVSLCWGVCFVTVSGDKVESAHFILLHLQKKDILKCGVSIANTFHAFVTVINLNCNGQKVC